MTNLYFKFSKKTNKGSIFFDIASGIDSLSLVPMLVDIFVAILVAILVATLVAMRTKIQICNSIFDSKSKRERKHINFFKFKQKLIPIFES
jgi:hypothetical protein